MDKHKKILHAAQENDNELIFSIVGNKKIRNFIKEFALDSINATWGYDDSINFAERVVASPDKFLFK